jgi:hypothetical protein
MDSTLSRILLELRGEMLSRSDAAADENMRCLVPRKGCNPHDLVDFLQSAADIWLDRARVQGITPATFYTWYDEMAGQVRFSTILGRSDVLPFRAAVHLVDTPDIIVSDALSTSTPGEHFFDEFTEIERDQPVISPTYTVRVWACTTKDAGCPNQLP